MPRPLITLRQSSFLGLTDDLAVEARPSQASILRNLYRLREKLIVRGGTLPLGDAALYPNTQIDGMAWFRLSGVDVLFTAHAGRVLNLLHTVYPHEQTNSSGKLTANRNTSFAVVDGRVYASDGLSPVIRLTSQRADRAMPVPPAVPTLADGGAGALPAATFSYRLVWLSADGNETAASPTASITLGASRSVAVTRPAMPAGQDISGWRLYRLPAGSTLYRVVTTIPDTTTGVYLDNLLDAVISVNAALNTSDRTAFPPCEILIEHEGRLVGARCADSSQGDMFTVYLSNFREPWYCPVLPTLTDPNQGTRISIVGAWAGEITGLVSHGDRIYVFTAGSMNALIGDQPLEFSLKLVAPHGCVAHRTIQKLHDRLFWAGADGVYMASQGQPLRRISDDLETAFRAIPAADRAKMHAFIWDSKFFLCWPTGAWWYDVRYDIWGEHTGWLWRTSATSLFQGTVNPRIFAAKEGAARVHELETGVTDDGAPIATDFASRDEDMGQPGREKRLHTLGALFRLSSGTVTARLYRGTGELIQTITYDLSTLPAPGAAITRMDERVTEAGRDEFFKIRLTHDDALGGYEILAVDGRWSLAT